MHVRRTSLCFLEDFREIILEQGFGVGTKVLSKS
jgi:hypothetical protein